jgi:hypothetical protein
MGRSTVDERELFSDGLPKLEVFGALPTQLKTAVIE